ncbi:MAG TPA: hypothetical protein VEI97_02955 [bacterium]|nr:hypothetical protein [bacterium]
MAEWYQDVFRQWPLALQLLAYVSVTLNAVIAAWLWFDTQRFEGRLNPAAWALGGLACASVATGVYWYRTGSQRAALAFGISLITALVLTGMYDQPIQQAVDLQIGHTLELLPTPGVNQGALSS